MRSKILRRRLVGTAAALAMLMTSACSTGSQADGDSGAVDSQNNTNEVAEQAAEALDALYDTGTFLEPADDSPPAQPDRRVALVIAGQQVPTGTKVAEAARETAETLGWDLSIYDGKYDPSEYQEGIRQGIAQKADAIWLFSIECPLVKTALTEAKDAGIPVFSMAATDCSDVDPDAASYFEGTLTYAGGDFLAWSEHMGAAQATWLLAQLGDKANVLEVSVPELSSTRALHEGFNAKMAELCPTCKITTLEVQTADFGPQLQEKISTALLRNPDVNGVALSYDDLATAGGAAAVMESGRNDSLLVIAGSNFAPTVDLIREDMGLDAGYVYDLEYDTRASADVINRYFAGAGAVQAGSSGIAVIDRDNGLPTEGEDWTVDIDFKSIYDSMWRAE